MLATALDQLSGFGSAVTIHIQRQALSMFMHDLIDLIADRASHSLRAVPRACYYSGAHHITLKRSGAVSGTQPGLCHHCERLPFCSCVDVWVGRLYALWLLPSTSH
eukprot:6190263-Pleurochrysis_carterae.AAC.3